MSGSAQDGPAKPGRNSLLHYTPALVFVAIAVADSQRWADTDLWGHLRFGQATLAAGHLIRRDPYSYSAPGHLWLNHEWLSEVLMALVYNAIGIVGLKLMKFAGSAAMVILIADAMAETGAPILVQFAILIAACLGMCPQLQFRPQMFTFAAFAATIAILSRFHYRGRARLWMLIPILAVWANLHGGFIMGLAAIGVFGAALAVQDLIAGRPVTRGLHLMLIGAAAALATLATPYGVGTWEAVVHALFNPHTRRVIIDWQSLYVTIARDVSSNPLRALFETIPVLMFATLPISVASAPDFDDLPMLAVAAVMIGAALTAMRNLPIAAIAVAAPLARHISLALRSRAGPAPSESGTRAYGDQIAIVAIGIAMLIATGLFSRRLKLGEPFPAGAVSFMRAQKLNGNLLTSFGWGEYAIWHLWPQDRIFIDGRYDTVFPPEVIDDYLAFHYGRSGAQQTLGKYRHDYVLVPVKNSRAYQLMKSLNGWSLLYRDDVAALFARGRFEGGGVAGLPQSEARPDHFFP